MNYELRIKKNKKGFTIIETLVAVSILVMAVTGPLSLASKGLAYSQYAKDEITAFYLANEAMEVVRNIRDLNLKGGGEWLLVPGTPGGSSNLTDKCSETQGCRLDVWGDNYEIEQIDSDTSAEMNVCEVVDVANSNIKSYFGYEFANLPDCSSTNKRESIFSRRVVVKEIGILPSNEIKVDVIVSWEAKNGLIRNVILSENLYKLNSL